MMYVSQYWRDIFSYEGHWLGALAPGDFFFIVEAGHMHVADKTHMCMQCRSTFERRPVIYADGFGFINDDILPKEAT